MSKFEFTAESRKDHGKSTARRLRRIEDRVPCVVYGAGKDSQSITLLHKDVLHALENEAVFSTILNLTVDGKNEQVVIKDIQRHSHKPKILHIDFFRVSAKEKITMNIPLHFVGEEEAPGVKEGGVFTKNLTEIEMRCLPNNLPEFVEVDVSQMNLEETIHVFDIKLPPGVELLQQSQDEEHNHPVVTLHTPKVTKEDIEAEAQEAEAAEEAAVESAASQEKAEEAAPSSETETDQQEEATKEE